MGNHTPKLRMYLVVRAAAVNRMLSVSPKAAVACAAKASGVDADELVAVELLDEHADAVHDRINAVNVRADCLATL